MMILIIAVQIALPLALLLWLALLPARNLLGFLLQSLGIGAFLFALARVSQWALPAWWLPWLYGALWLAAVVVLAVRRGPSARSLIPRRVRGWVTMLVSICLLVIGSRYGVLALAGQSLPPVPVIDIANPFGPGQYIVGHGGSDPLVNGHMRTLDTSVERFRPWRGQSYAVDFSGIGPWGLRASGWRPADPSAYAIFGARLHAPCNGEVISTESSMPDFRVPKEDRVNRLGNHVILRCDGAYIVLAHMQQGSVSVAPGDTLTTGDLIGEVGNSGASTEPHLHIHAQRPPPEGQPPISGDPLALRIDGRFLVRNDRLTGQEW
ncbi:M23 family metallopeptidase [Nodosilinea sp. LEGE 07088]|uniref:M23 family metallopeptidase n=1 Tax=Nodosilinea sp. LEGE 07088 TaxID=2777968 RepID=UPI0018813D80|nr:M23 family metallopeptidase [Nodosilinea sp. LEGE 07088]MBE9137071.1 M23 family metallopeptidase [Nodosilinea sp. LEGE 07088]